MEVRFTHVSVISLYIAQNILPNCKKIILKLGAVVETMKKWQFDSAFALEKTFYKFNFVILYWKYTVVDEKDIAPEWRWEHLSNEERSL